MKHVGQVDDEALDIWTSGVSHQWGQLAYRVDCRDSANIYCTLVTRSRDFLVHDGPYLYMSIPDLSKYWIISTIGYFSARAMDKTAIMCSAAIYICKPNSDWAKK